MKHCKKNISLSIFLILFSPLTWATCTGLGCTCTVSTNAVSFGAINPNSSSNTDTTGNVQVTCSVILLGLNVSYTIGLNSGNGGGFTPRAMTNNANNSYQLNYNLYSDSGRSIIWGNGTAGTSLVSDSYSINVISVTRNYTVYARIPGSQINAAAGNYSDSIIATVTY